MTAVHAARAGNPPLAFTRRAIMNHLAHQATNGPAYIQFQATNAMARAMGLYEEGKLIARQVFQAVQDAATQVADQAQGGYERVAQLLDGAKVTEADLGGFAKSAKRTNDDQDEEEGSNQDDDEPP